MYSRNDAVASAAMDKICAIAKKHNVKVIEDVSHAHGGRYKGQMVRTARVVVVVVVVVVCERARDF